MTGFEYSFIRYLSAKKSVDDRALNQEVWDSLAASLPDTSPENPLRILEIGAGTATMLVRMLERNLIDFAEYTAIDTNEECINFGKHQIPIMVSEQGYAIKEDYAGGILLGENTWVKFRLEEADLHDFITEYEGSKTWDLIVAHAFLDLVHVRRTLPMLFNLCEAGGLLYFTLNYDGLTIFEPTIQPAFDKMVLSAYDKTMDQRLVDGLPSGDSHTGRHLFNHLKDVGVQIIAAGSSDWVVHPSPDGYPRDEAYFLHYIIHTIDEALKEDPDIDPDGFKGWIAERHAQVDRQDLVYIAHQIDIVGKK
jgi:SAM-dependent methyltransferase